MQAKLSHTEIMEILKIALNHFIISKSTTFNPNP